MLAELIERQRDPVVLADLPKRRLRNKTPQLVEALTGRFREHQDRVRRAALVVSSNLGRRSTNPRGPARRALHTGCVKLSETKRRMRHLR